MRTSLTAALATTCWRVALTLTIWMGGTQVLLGDTAVLHDVRPKAVMVDLRLPDRPTRSRRPMGGDAMGDDDHRASRTCAGPCTTTCSPATRNKNRLFGQHAVIDDARRAWARTTPLHGGTRAMDTLYGMATATTTSSGEHG